MIPWPLVIVVVLAVLTIACGILIAELLTDSSEDDEEDFEDGEPRR